MTVTAQGDTYKYSKGGVQAETANIVKDMPIGYVATATWTAVAAAIGAGDVMGAVATLTWLDANGLPFPGGELMIRSLVFEVDETALQASEAAYAIKMYGVTPPSAIADNGVWDLPAGDRASYIGALPITAPVDVGSTLLTEIDNINKQITVPATGLTFAYLMTVAGFTPTATARKVKIHAQTV